MCVLRTHVDPNATLVDAFWKLQRGQVFAVAITVSLEQRLCIVVDGEGPGHHRFFHGVSVFGVVHQDAQR